MARSKSSKRWLKEHFDDPFVKRAQQEGYRSRAVYKLQELQERDRLLKPGMTLVDLGAAPGGWCQYAAKIVGDRGRIVAMDILPMDPVAGVNFLQGDFRDDAVLNELMALVGDGKVDLILSDMAPNMSGTDIIDQPRAMYLCELAVDFAHKVLCPGGDLVMKMFQGSGMEDLVKELRTRFGKVVFRKPKASRPRSPEVYVVARGYKV
jgi:23S rRNA (uridine2552-2'-O)-methyltransferase